MHEKDNILIEENQNMAFDENMEELKSTNNMKQSNNSEINNINEFTFKRSTIVENSKIKSRIVNNIDVDEMDQTHNAEHASILGSDYKNKRDPLVHDYPLEITNSLGEDYDRLNINKANEDFLDINHS
jgi:hypothetical protein